jgi:Icc-related predicted phosphoesterase
MMASGYYFYVCDLREYEKLREEKGLREELFRRLMAERLEHQLRRIEQEVPREIRVIMNPGNDDDFFVDDILKRSERVRCTLGTVEELGQGLSLISCEWVNPTPWNSPRECSEEELYGRLRAEFQRAGDAKGLLCDIHAPPYNTTLDLAPKLDKELRPKRNLFGQPVMEHVGSRAVRRALQEFQPLLSLHGHIHESPGSYRLGRTLCLNPGSEYEEGIMHGHLVIVEGGAIDFQPVIGA